MTERSRISGVKVNRVAEPETRTVESLAGDWRLELDPDNRGLAEQWADTPLDAEHAVPVPGCIQSLSELAEEYPTEESVQDQLGLQNSYLGTAWMERTFETSETTPGDRAWIKFGGICPAAHVWVNGAYVGYHGRTPVAVKWDVTDLLDGDRNRLTVAIVEEDTGLANGVRPPDWSGLFREVEVETTRATHAENVVLRPEADEGKLQVSGTIHNASAEAVELRPTCTVRPWSADGGAGEGATSPVQVEPGQHRQFSLSVDITDPEYWSPENPALYEGEVALERNGEVVDDYRERVGLRTFSADGDGLRLNGEPFIARGGGQEFFSPTISPLVDRDLIEDRFRSMREHGLNFRRYHTHFPTDEELQVADELGLLLCSEGASLVSNFNALQPYEEATDVLVDHISQTRNHPSMGAYCLGNEGSQVMVGSETERRRAREGYDLIKEHAPDHIGMIAFGMQGELPDLPNDVETPHFWGRNFQWAYAGLSRIPWRFLAPIIERKASILHEYGKFGVWPDPEEEALYPDDGYDKPFGKAATDALSEAGLDDLEGRLVDASRTLAYRCNRNVLEQARRQPGTDGYVQFRFFRRGHRNSGVIDDMGREPDVDPALYRERCNAPVAILIDRDFDGHTLAGGSTEKIGLHVSNFGSRPLRDERLRWELRGQGETITGGAIDDLTVPKGTSERAGSASIDVPAISDPGRVDLAAEIVREGETVASNQWPFWLFPDRAPVSDPITVHDIEDDRYARHLRAHDSGVVQLEDANSILTGCRTRQEVDPDDLREAPLQESREALGTIALDDIFGSPPSAVLLADQWNSTVTSCLDRGTDVLMVDTGHFPAEWYPDPYPDGSPFDVNRLFTPFRSGESEGTIVTLVHSHPIWERFPHEGFCDLQYFEMIQDARPVITERVADSLSHLSKSTADPSVLLRPVPNLSRGETSIKTTGLVATEDWAYVLEARVGESRLVICTPNLLDDPGGRYLLEELRSYLGGSTRES